MTEASALLQPNPFSSDAGDLEEAVARAFELDERSRPGAVVAALGRVLVGGIPHTDPGRNPDGSVVDHDFDHSLEENSDGLIWIDFSPGRRALAIFSSAHSYSSFASSYEPASTARPIPLYAKDAAILALSKGDGLLVLDPYSPTAQWIGRSASAALASGQPWTPPWLDERILGSITAALDQMRALGVTELGALDRLSVDPGQAGVTYVHLGVKEGTARQDISEILSAVTEVIASDPYVRARLDMVEIRPLR